jgi:hypothetical protein
VDGRVYYAQTARREGFAVSQGRRRGSNAEGGRSSRLACRVSNSGDGLAGLSYLHVQIDARCGSAVLVLLGRSAGLNAGRRRGTDQARRAEDDAVGRCSAGRQGRAGHDRHNRLIGRNVACCLDCQAGIIRDLRFPNRVARGICGGEFAGPAWLQEYIPERELGAAAEQRA